MGYDSLQIFLPAFMFVFIGVITVWAHLRKTKKINTTPGMHSVLPKKVKVVDMLFSVFTFDEYRHRDALCLFPGILPDNRPH